MIISGSGIVRSGEKPLPCPTHLRYYAKEPEHPIQGYIAPKWGDNLSKNNTGLEILH
jgi:hypothetical protein